VREIRQGMEPARATSLRPHPSSHLNGFFAVQTCFFRPMHVAKYSGMNSL
jgi:hypothetical protein